MKRFFLSLFAASTVAVVGFALPRPAAAFDHFDEIQPKMYCAARVSSVSSVRGFPGLWRYDLSGVSTFHARVDLTIGTDTGTFDADVPDVHVRKDDGLYVTPYARFGRHEYRSRAQFVLLPPDAGPLQYIWVRGIGKVGATVLGACPAMGGVPFSTASISMPTPPPAKTKYNPTPGFNPYYFKRLNPSVFNPHARPNIAEIVQAQRVGPAAQYTCTDPFRLPRMVKIFPASYPMLPHSVTGTVPISALVQLGTHNNVTGATLLTPTGVRDFDATVLRIVENSQYRSGTALCKPAPSEFLFIEDFEGTGQ